ncbi:unnamed protein product [Anisakis simplex]|uniref:Leucine-rich repeat and death domain-containing protein 1 n=1 Tax=Anisakis simplex TaxID=6269 RepID=A0A0M3KAJ1_ANISI|nr:unnamed protein product [Anisakis simplex]
MEELSLKDLKAVLDDNELDLSMRQLTVIPTRALAKLPRATHIDFSNNQILTIPPEFCLLTHITKLDLSNNRIVHLPNDFGKLVNLEHLDLYKNSIEVLLFVLIGPRMQKQSKETPNRTYAPNKPTSQSCLSRVFGLIRKLMMLLVIVTLVGIALSSFIIFDNCSQESHHWIPSSQPFCDDLHKLIQHRKYGCSTVCFLILYSISRKNENFLKVNHDHLVVFQLSTTFTKNLYQTLSSMGWVYMAKLREVQSDIEEGGFIEKIQYYCSSFYTKLVAVAFVVQKYASEWFAVLQKWYSENASDYVADFVDNVVIALKMLLIIFSDFAVFIVEKGSTAIMTLSDNVVYYMEHRDELLRTIEHWWINLK